MESKYYTPKIEEFHVGFDFEVYEDYDVLSEKSWHKETYPSDTASQFYINEGLLRVKCLDREDIESLGLSVSVMGNGGLACNGNGLSIFVEGTKLNIKKYSEEDPYAIKSSFQGTIKNKSELKKVLKQIGYDDPNRRNS